MRLKQTADEVMVNICDQVRCFTDFHKIKTHKSSRTNKYNIGPSYFLEASGSDV